MKVWIVEHGERYDDTVTLEVFASQEGAQASIDGIVLAKGSRWKRHAGYPAGDHHDACLAYWLLFPSLMITLREHEVRP
jgi:hypothetical protein